MASVRTRGVVLVRLGEPDQPQRFLLEHLGHLEVTLGFLLVRLRIGQQQMSLLSHLMGLFLVPLRLLTQQHGGLLVPPRVIESRLRVLFVLVGEARRLGRVSLVLLGTLGVSGRVGCKFLGDSLILVVPLHHAQIIRPTSRASCSLLHTDTIRSCAT